MRSAYLEVREGFRNDLEGGDEVCGGVGAEEHEFVVSQERADDAALEEHVEVEVW